MPRPPRLPWAGVLVLVLVLADGISGVDAQSNAAECVTITGSQQCPDYNNRVKVNLTLNANLNHFSQVTEFDAFVNRTIEFLSLGLLSNAGSDLGCPTWDLNYLQYVRGFICEVIYTSDQVIGKCTDKSTVPTLCASQCKSMYDSTFNLINNNCPPNSTVSVVQARTNTLQSINNICAASTTNCFPGLTNEQTNCGFTAYQSASDFCNQTNSANPCCTNLVAPTSAPSETPKEKRPGCFPSLFGIFSCDIVYGAAAGLCFGVLGAVAFVLVLQEQKRNRSLMRIGGTGSAERVQYKMPPGGGGVVPGRRSSAQYSSAGGEAYFDSPSNSVYYPPSTSGPSGSGAPRFVSVVASPVPSQNVSMVFVTSQAPANGTLGAPVTYAQPIYSVAPAPSTLYRTTDNRDSIVVTTAPRSAGAGSSSSPSSVAVRDFDPEQEGDIRLIVGDRVVVKESYGDGWASGINLTTREEGVFPQSHVS
ncbi:hypothetical protein BJ742DRAFT_739906 [Cladochytrium replicatum]|nr:hypothetical protein BJ742DRAFT_739906 [Cladochytrium replicatum]